MAKLYIFGFLYIIAAKELIAIIPKNSFELK